MVRPVAFGFNPETSASNAFQSVSPLSPEEIHLRALEEFDQAVYALERAGVSVRVLQDSPEPKKPDAIFPNNWISLHEDKTAVLYPMLSPQRRAERNHELIMTIFTQEGVQNVIDLSAYEHDDVFLEGTGSLVLDRVHRIAYAARSPRTHPDLVTALCQAIDYEPLMFTALDPHGTPVYHTNVLMCIASNLALIAIDGFVDLDERKTVISRLSSTGHEIVMLTHQQIGCFAGNMLEVQGHERRLVMSDRAASSLTENQMHLIRAAGLIPLIIDLDIIETVGGGSIRCMMLENFIDSGN